MGRKYKKGDILAYVGEQDWLKGHTIQLEIKYGNVWHTVSDEDGIYTEAYLDDDYVFILNALETDKPQDDTLNEEDRYLTLSGKQLYDVLKDDLLTPEQFEGFVLGNIYKYVKRYKHKNGAKDLKKAKDYIDLLIIDMEENEYE